MTPDQIAAIEARHEHDVLQGPSQFWQPQGYGHAALSAHEDRGSLIAALRAVTEELAWASRVLHRYGITSEARNEELTGEPCEARKALAAVLDRPCRCIRLDGSHVPECPEVIYADAIALARTLVAPAE